GELPQPCRRSCHPGIEPQCKRLCIRPVVHRESHCITAWRCPWYCRRVYTAMRDGADVQNLARIPSAIARERLIAHVPFEAVHPCGGGETCSRCRPIQR